MLIDMLKSELEDVMVKRMRLESDIDRLNQSIRELEELEEERDLLRKDLSLLQERVRELEGTSEEKEKSICEQSPLPEKSQEEEISRMSCTDCAFHAVKYPDYVYTVWWNQICKKNPPKEIKNWDTGKSDWEFPFCRDTNGDGRCIYH